MTMTAPSVTGTAPTKRYHPGIVVLHWLIAILILVTALLAGDEGERSRQAVGGISTLGIHMILGITVLILLLVRLVLRWRTPHPDWATAGNAFLDAIGRWTHFGLYFFAFAVTVTGLVLALQTNRLTRVFNGSSPRQFNPGGFQPGQFPPPGGFQPGAGARPEGFEGGFPRSGRFFLGAFHGASWVLLLLLMVVHVGAALYHQFLRKDNLFGRMWFGGTA